MDQEVGGRRLGDQLVAEAGVARVDDGAATEPQLPGQRPGFGLVARRQGPGGAASQALGQAEGLAGERLRDLFLEPDGQIAVEAFPERCQAFPRARGCDDAERFAAPAPHGVQFEKRKPPVVVAVKVAQHHGPEIVARESFGAEGGVATRPGVQQEPEPAAEGAHENRGLALSAGAESVAGPEKTHLDSLAGVPRSVRPGTPRRRPLAAPADEGPPPLTLRLRVERAVAPPAALQPGRRKRGGMAFEHLRDERHDAFPVSRGEEPGVLERILVRPSPGDQANLDVPARTVVLVGVGEDADFEQSIASVRPGTGRPDRDPGRRGRRAPRAGSRGDPPPPDGIRGPPGVPPAGLRARVRARG